MHIKLNKRQNFNLNNVKTILEYFVNPPAHIQQFNRRALAIQLSRISKKRSIVQKIKNFEMVLMQELQLCFQVSKNSIIFKINFLLGNGLFGTRLEVFCQDLEFGIAS